MPSRVALVKHAISGRLASAKSKTGLPQCSQAASAWAKHQATSAVFAILARCRAAAKVGKQAMFERKLAGEGGSEAKAQHLIHRIRSGAPLTTRERTAKAKELRSSLAESRAARAERQTPRPVHALGRGTPERQQAAHVLSTLRKGGHSGVALARSIRERAVVRNSWGGKSARERRSVNYNPIGRGEKFVASAQREYGESSYGYSEEQVRGGAMLTPSGKKISRSKIAESYVDTQRLKHNFGGNVEEFARDREAHFRRVAAGYARSAMAVHHALKASGVEPEMRHSSTPTIYKVREEFAGRLRALRQAIGQKKTAKSVALPSPTPTPVKPAPRHVGAIPVRRAEGPARYVPDRMPVRRADPKPAVASEPIRKGTAGLIHTLKVAIKGRGRRRLESAARVAENLRRSHVAAGQGAKAARIAEHAAKIRRMATA